MSNIPILDLPVAVGTLSGTEYVAIVQGTGGDAVTRRATVAQIGNTATGFVPISRTITTSTALSGGGALSGDLTLSFTPSTLLVVTTQAAADTYVIQQDSSGAPRQVTFANSMKAIGTLSVSPALSLTDDKFVVLRAADGLSYYATASQIGTAAGNVPAGGTTGQVLAKASSTNYDTNWINNSLMLDAYSVSANPTGATATSISLTGTAYQVLRMANDALGLAFGSIDISQSAVVGTSVLNVANGGTGRASLTNHGVLVGAGTSGVTQLAAAAAGTLLTGQGASSDPAFSATPTLGIAGTTLGTLSLSGNTSGVVTIQPQAAAGTFNFNLPTSAGTSGYVLTSAGGASSPMTWTAPGSLAVSLVVGSTTISSGTTTRILYDNAGTLGEYAISGAGSVAMTTNPVLSGPTITSPVGVDSVNTGSISGFRNRIINGGMSINQRVPSSNADDTYSLDRWIVLTQTGTVAASTLTSVEDTTPYMMRLTQSEASAQRYGVEQIIEGFNCSDFRGQAVTLSARVRMSASTTLRYAILEWTGTVDVVTSDVVNDWTSGTYTAGNFFNSTSLTVTATGSTALTANELTSVSLSATLGSSLNNVIVFFWTSSTQAQNVTLDVAKVQFEPGATASVFERRPYGVEFFLTQRYFETIGFVPGTAPANGVPSFFTFGQAWSVVSLSINYKFSAPKRNVSYTVTTYSGSSGGTGGTWGILVAGGWQNATTTAVEAGRGTLYDFVVTSTKTTAFTVDGCYGTTGGATIDNEL